MKTMGFSPSIITGVVPEYMFEFLISRDKKCAKKSISKHMCSTMYIFVHGKYFV
jgi:hypothetical protein